MKKINGLPIFVISIILLLTWTFLKSSFKTKVQPRSSKGYTINNDGENLLNRNTGHLIITKHARCRMECRHINQEEINEILHDGIINYKKSEPNGNRGPKYALEGYTHEHQHLRIVFAPETDAIVVVTCIDLDNEWACGECN